MKDFKVRIGNGKWEDVQAADMPGMKKLINKRIKGPLTSVIVITHDLNLLNFKVVSMGGKFKWIK